MPSREDYPYASCYCEENVYKLLELLNDHQYFYAVLISNERKTIPLWSQKAALTVGDYVLWDYHVIAVEKKDDSKSLIYDLDTTLEWPQDFQTYWQETMKPDMKLSERFQRKFRLIDATTFLSMFSSDRKHMLEKDGTWKKPPPKWPLINQHNKSNLMDLIDVNKCIEGTEMMNEDQFFQSFS